MARSERKLTAGRSLLCGGLILALAILVPARAQAQTASGSVGPLPSDSSLVAGQIIDVTVRVTNTSVGPTPFPFIPATLTGTTTVILASANGNFTAPIELPGTLLYLPQATASTCLSNIVEVSSCAAQGGNSNRVDITLSTGVVIGANSFVDIATIKVQAVTPILPTPLNPTGLFHMPASTGPTDLDAAGAKGAAAGDTLLTFPAVCGDGIVQPALGETCDPADPNAPPNCRAAGTTDECTFCGDAIQQSTSGETCDPADPNAAPGCRAAGTTDECTFCGDTVVQPGSETCDPADPNAPPGCRPAGGTDECTFCGDGATNGDEACDPADPNAPADCRAQGTTDDCTACGDGCAASRPRRRRPATLPTPTRCLADVPARIEPTNVRPDGDGVQQSTTGEACDPADPNAPADCRAQGTTDECTACGDASAAIDAT